jgi:hypothetical protein
VIDNFSVPTRLGALADGLTISRGVPTQVTAPSGQLPVLSVPELRTGAVAKRFVNEGVLGEAHQGIAVEEDVLISLEGAAAGEIFVVPGHFPNFVPSQQVAVIRILDRARLDPWYLGAFLSTESARNQMRRLARGEKVQRIPVKDLDTVTIPLLQISTQSSYGGSYRAYQKAIRAHRATAEHLERMCAADVETTFVP